jgi:hypothetical protein
MASVGQIKACSGIKLLIEALAKMYLVVEETSSRRTLITRKWNFAKK